MYLQAFLPGSTPCQALLLLGASSVSPTKAPRIPFCQECWSPHSRHHLQPTNNLQSLPCLPRRLWTSLHTSSPVGGSRLRGCPSRQLHSKATNCTTRIARHGKQQARENPWPINKNLHCAGAHGQAWGGRCFSSQTLPTSKGWYLVHGAGAGTIARDISLMIKH